MNTYWRRSASILLFCALAARLWAGGSGLNVVVVVNQNSTNSVQLGNYYCEQRQVPPQNYLRINWAGGNISWTLTDFTNCLYSPLRAMLSNGRLTNQIDYIVLSMDIPYQLSASGSTTLNSTTAALYYGFKPDPSEPCSLASGSTSLYAGSEGIFRSTPPISATSNAFLVTMITANNLPLAKLVVDSGVSSDFTFPVQTVYLAKGPDVDRNVRYVNFDNAIFNTRLGGNCAVQRIDSYGIGGLGCILGAQSGAYYYGFGGVSFAPGAMADNLTSYGGILFQDSGGQLNILSFLAAGAAGTYGTVYEPCNYLAKFPTPQNYFYQARGFSLAECYYQSVTNPYQGLVLGEPLAAPFAQPAAGSWLTPANALLRGSTNLSVQFTASDTNHPIQQVDLFLDGVWLQTLTNIPPGQGNALYVKLNGFTTNYTVPASATLLSVASNLTSRLNAESGSTKVAAFAHGDRIELQSTDSSKSGTQVSLSVSNSAGSAVTTFIRATGTNLLDTIASGWHNLTVESSVTYPPPANAWLLLTVTKTNGSVVKVGSTNNSTTLTNIALLVSNLVNQVNGNSLLMAADGCAAGDFIDYSIHVNPANHGAEFNLAARAPGWGAAGLQAALTSSSPLVFSITPIGTRTLQDNLSDLEPRAHLYVTAGATGLPLTFAFNTTTQADGCHELTAVAYEGSHVRTQKRIAHAVRVQNSSLAAAFTTLVGGTNTALEATLRFSIVANTNNISKIELFSTGGSLTNILSQSNVVFSVAGTNLGLGLHPFYAVVTASSGQQYRTETKWIRLVGRDAPFSVSIAVPPPRLAWSATAGRSYDILSATNVTNVFQAGATVTPSNSAAQWTDTNSAVARRFYRVRTSN